MHLECISDSVNWDIANYYFGGNEVCFWRIMDFVEQNIGGLLNYYCKVLTFLDVS